MDIELVAVVRRVMCAPNGSPLCLTSVDLIYPDGRDCGVPMFVEGYEEASRLLMKFGVKLDEHRAKFESDAEVRIPLTADKTVVREMGFNPRD
jgi:hypothetical protein